MRCSQARKLVDRLLESGQSLSGNTELTEHLRNCRDCASEAQAAATLQTVIKSERGALDENLPSLNHWRQRTETLLATDRGRSHLSWWARPRTAMAATALAAVLALLMLVPFRYHRVVGYHLALHGVSHDLAVNEERLCNLFFDLGLFDADYNLLGCDTTCRLLVVDLRTPEEAYLLVDALERLEDDPLMAELVPVEATQSGSLLDRANESLLGGAN